MNFDLNDDQREIKSTTREFLAARFKPAKVRELAESRSYDDGLTKEIAELGWPGIAVSEEHGGQGLGVVELTILLEEVGYACAPSPLTGTVGAALLIEAAGSDDQKAEWLPKLASGEAVGAWADVSGDRDALACDLPVADVAVILSGDEAKLAPGAEVKAEEVEAIDATRRYSLVSSAAAGDAMPGDAAAGRDRLTVALAGELTGIAQRGLEMAVEYAKERHQFDRPIGAYQGVSHRCAAILAEVEESRSLAYYAAWTADAEPESLPLAAAMAGARSADGGWSATSQALQVFGGIGFTWEHDLQFWLKRARVTGSLLGSARSHRDRVAELSGLGDKVTAPA